ncbi:hypothetical protein JST56_01285 [Candidatus Dependentiae bacterium]|nr:hypothetical protein [Candidatus Dependentiae bacterium]
MKKTCASYVLCVGILASLIVSLNAKKLTVPQIGLLNLALGALPQVTARLKLAQKYSHDACEMLNKMNQPAVQGTANSQMTKQAINAQIKKMFEPVREFFGQILEHKDMVVPLIAQSLAAYPSMQQATASSKTLAETSYLLAFFNEHTKDIIEFFEKCITNQQDFNQITHELKYFMDDLFESFSQHVLESYNRMIKDIQAKKVTTKPSTRANISEELFKQVLETQDNIRVA